jgi:2-polyprenyl-6-methoxyphenol hydroxylase-like FAD-dependent oxidoreductase
VQLTFAQPYYQGILFLTSNISTKNEHYSVPQGLAGDGNMMLLGNGEAIFIFRLFDGSYYVGVAIRVPEQWRKDNAALLDDPNKMRQELVTRFADWPESQTNIIKYSDAGFHAWAQYSLAPEDISWKSVPGVTLIGDAAHLTYTIA